MKTIQMNLKDRSYPIYLGRGMIQNVSKYISLERKVCIISDDGVPQTWIDHVVRQCPHAIVHIVKQGERSKSMGTFESCLEVLLQHQFGRKDCIIALGGGVVGDLAGFVAASYMRGIDFIQIPTTTLSQIDSSIGGKVAINMNKVKNCVGAFWQPKAVFVDPDTLSTLSARHFNSGLVEAIKAGCLGDEKLLSYFEDVEQNLVEILYRSLLFKKQIVEEDETETGIRKILNLGHTFGHAFESHAQLGELYHGEAVALGMLMVIQEQQIHQQLYLLFRELNIPLNYKIDVEAVFHYIQLDKKGVGDAVSLITLDELQKPMIKKVAWDKIYQMIQEAKNEEFNWK